VRRFTAGLAVTVAVTGTLLVLPVYTAPVAQAVPVATSIDEVLLGSVSDPEGAAVVTTDGEVEDGGADAGNSSAPAPTTSAPSGSTSAAPSSPAPSSTSDTPAPTGSATPEPADAGDAPVSGEELPGIPALAVSRPDTEPFESVGITWRHDPTVVDVIARVRVEDEDGTWGGWTTLERDDVVQNVTAETRDNDIRDGTAPYWTGPARGIEAIVQAADGTVPQDVRIALIDPGESAADALPAAAAPPGQAHAAGPMPRVYSRAEWGADERIRTWAPEYASTIKAATVHHTADSNDYTADRVPAILRSMYAYHAQTRGWGDIGYNVIIDKFGRIFEGRYGGLASTVIGAHAGGFNTYTFGVSMLGNYDDVAVPQATVDAVSSIIAWKLGLFRVDPRGTTVLTSGGGGTSKYAAGVNVRLPTIFGHRDVGSTACPGRYGYARLTEIRDRVARLSGNRTLLRTPDDTTVYVVSGNTKYEVPDVATLQALAPLGGVGFIAQQYLDTLATGPKQGRVVHSPDGTIYFLDSGVKLPFRTCTMVADYGGSCSSLVRWDQSLIDAYRTGPAITSLYRTTSGKAFFVSGGVKREALDDAALTQASLSTAGVQLSEAGLSSLPYGVPITRDGVVVRNRFSGGVAVAAGGAFTQVSPGVREATALSSWPVRDLDDASLRKLPGIGRALGAWMQEAGGGRVFLLTETGKREVTDPAVRPAVVPQVPTALLAAFPDAGTFGAGAYLKGSVGRTVFVVDAGRRRPVLSWADMLALNNGLSPTASMLTVGQRVVDLLPTGPAQLGPGSLVVSPASRTVFLVDDKRELIPIPSFAVAAELGATRLVRVTPADVTAYTVRPTRLTTAVDCAGTKYLGLGATLYKVGTAVAPHFPLTYTALDPLSCRTLPKASIELSRFLRASTGRIYYIENGVKRAIPTYARYVALGGTSATTIQASDFALSLIPTGPTA
jgi:hypothetical protein